MSFLDRVRAVQVWNPAAYRPFVVDGRRVGHVGTPVAHALADFPAVFRVTDDAVTLDPDLDRLEARTAAVDRVVRALEGRAGIGRWRGEAYPVTTGFTEPPLLLLDRGAVPAFGVRAYGLHVNGIVRDGSGLRMWLGRRALDRPVEPGKLDQMVAGGQPAGLSLAENLCKECAEEAAIPPELASRAVPVGAITYLSERPDGLRNDVLFIYDLNVPADFEPRNTDGEIAEFMLWPIDRVVEAVRDGDAFKFNCSLVVIDFALRHGLIPPDHSDYVALAEGLRSGGG